jgi:hypothetical protein
MFTEENQLETTHWDHGGKSLFLSPTTLTDPLPGDTDNYPGPNVSRLLGQLQWKGDEQHLYKCSLQMGKPELLQAVLRMGIPAGSVEDLFECIASDLALRLGI